MYRNNAWNVNVQIIMKSLSIEYEIMSKSFLLILN